MPLNYRLLPDRVEMGIFRVSLGCGVKTRHAAEHVVEDTAVLVVNDLVNGIDAAEHRDAVNLAVGAVDGERQVHARG